MHKCVRWCLFVSQCVCHSDSLELPSYDVGMEECCLSGGGKHTRLETCSGKTHKHKKYYCLIYIILLLIIKIYTIQ